MIMNKSKIESRKEKKKRKTVLQLASFFFFSFATEKLIVPNRPSTLTRFHPIRLKISEIFSSGI